MTLPDIGYGATHGDALEEALHQAEDLLEEAVLGMMADDEEVPSPSRARGRPIVGLPALTAAKRELYRAMRAAGLSKDQLAARLNWTSSQVTRPFDGRRAARLDKVEAAPAALGRRLVVTSGLILLRLEEDEGMGRTVTEAIDALPPARRAKIEARAAELIAEELSLQEI